MIQSTYGQEDRTFHHGVARLDSNRCDSAGKLSLDVVLHLHGFKHEYDIAYVNLLAYVDL